MRTDDTIEFVPAAHPDSRVGRVGFELTHPYVEHCWAPIVGPSATLLLRRLPLLWMDEAPARVATGDLARSLGLGAGVGVNSRLGHTLDRLARFGLASGDRKPGVLEVYTHVPPLRPHHLARLPEWSRRTHDQLLGAHLDALGPGTAVDPRVTSLTARLDRLQQPRGPFPAVASRPQANLGR
jgi:hypothetical protein